MDQLLTVKEVAELLHVSTESVYRWATDGRLSSVRLGRAIRFPARGVQVVLNSGLPNSIIKPVASRRRVRSRPTLRRLGAP